MKLQLFRIFAFLALVGVINAAVIEPAICYADDCATEQQAEEGDCCAVCHPAHYQGVIRHAGEHHFADTLMNAQIAPLKSLFLDPPIRSIFHPPTIS